MALKFCLDMFGGRFSFLPGIVKQKTLCHETLLFEEACSRSPFTTEMQQTVAVLATGGLPLRVNMDGVFNLTVRIAVGLHAILSSLMMAW